jgi:hypothetical protein
VFFTFPKDVHLNAERQAVEFGVEIGEYRSVVRVPRRVFQRLLPERPTRALRRSVLSPTDAVREHRPAEAAQAAVERGRQRRDQRAGFAIGARWGRCRHECLKSTRSGHSRPATSRAVLSDGFDLQASA